MGADRGGGSVMKRSFGVGVAIAFAVTSAPAWAQDLTAGKTPPQLFSSDCSACHRSPAGLAKGRDSRTLAGFLKEHYTTKSENANALAAYVSTYSGRDPPPPAADAKRGRRDADAGSNGEESRPGHTPEEPPARRRRTVNLSGEGEKPRTRDDGSRQRAAAVPARQTGESPPESIRLPRAVSPAPSRQREPVDAFEQIRNYLTSGLGLESLAVEAAKARPSTARRRKNEIAQPQGEPAAEPAKSEAEPPVATGTVSAGVASPGGAAARSDGAGTLSPGAEPAASPAPQGEPPAATPSGPASPASGSADSASVGTAAAAPPRVH
jgi:hypothetical protein